MAIQPLSKYQGGKSLAEYRRDRKTEKAGRLRDVYRAVDHRDQGKCRVCGRKCSTTAIGITGRAERHHVIPRSLGGQDTTGNLALVCWDCHDDRHRKGTLRITGDADQRDERGYLSGLTVEILTEAGWKVAVCA